MDTDFSIFKIAEIAPARILPYNGVREPAIFVLGAQPEAVYSPKIILIPSESRVNPPLSEGGLEGDGT